MDKNSIDWAKFCLSLTYCNPAVKIARMRKADGLTQSQLGKIAGCSVNTICQMERGKYMNKEMRFIVAICNHFNCRIGWLLEAHLCKHTGGQMKDNELAAVLQQHDQKQREDLKEMTEREKARIDMEKRRRQKAFENFDRRVKEMEANMKRGYPNPNYTDEDFGMPPIDLTAEICLDDKEYRELVGKAYAFDIIVNEIKSKIDFNAYTSDYSLVDDDMILQVTGMAAYRRRKIFEEDQKAKATASAEEPEKEAPENE